MFANYEKKKAQILKTVRYSFRAGKKEQTKYNQANRNQKIKNIKIQTQPKKAKYLNTLKNTDQFNSSTERQIFRL